MHSKNRMIIRAGDPITLDDFLEPSAFRELNDPALTDEPDWSFDFDQANSAICRLGERAQELDDPRRNPNGTRETAKARLARSQRLFAGKIGNGIGRWRLSLAEHTAWAALHGHDRRRRFGVAANEPLRYLLGCAFIDMMVDMFEAHPGRRFFLVTVIHDGWWTRELRTRINLLDIRRRGYQVLHQIDIPAFAVIETQAALNWRAGLGRLILPHLHAIAWTDDPSFNADRVAATINNGRRLRSARGAPPVKIEPIDQTLGDIAHAAGYPWKAPFEGKDFVPASAKHPKGYVFARSESVRPSVLLRLDEVLTQMAFSELMIAHACPDEGLLMRRALRNYEGANINSGRIPSAATFWRRARVRNGRDQYQEVSFTR